MQWSYFGTSSRRFRTFAVLVSCAACQAELTAPAVEDSNQSPAPLHRSHKDWHNACAPGAGDTTCDNFDDDCDDSIDEDCDFGPSDCPEGTNVIAGTRKSDLLWGTNRADCILGYGGNDLLLGFGGDDVLVGGPGDDALSGGDGDDALFGDRGDDALFGDRGNDELDGGEGNDYLFGGEGNDGMRGGACHDNMIGLAGRDMLHGGEGSDRILASSPHRADGGGGVDACTGTSCELTGRAARLCLRDSDCGSGKRCVPGSLVCVAEADLSAADATCDGYDDDCDGRVDEDYASTTVECGVGACAGVGTSACVDGTEVVTDCTPAEPAPDDATCDGIDDDCDGQSDEDYEPQVTTCEVSGCRAHGATACLWGAEHDMCMTEPMCFEEIACQDESDNDGDGRADCADPDCQDEEHCAPQEFAITIMGRANLWGAGQEVPPGGTGGGELPPGIDLRHRGGAVLTFTSVSGTIFDFERAWGPDGLPGATNVPDAAGIAGYRLFTRARGMIGVFLDDETPALPAPTRLMFEDAEFTEIAPGLRQAFFIGDGRTDTGVVQRFIVPQGATRLFLGHADSCSSTVPGCFSDNGGAFEAQGDLRFDP